MSSAAVRLRSVLYMPGANERALEKARELPADALILDLEDAVAPEAKAQARERVCEAAALGAYRRADRDDSRQRDRHRRGTTRTWPPRPRPDLTRSSCRRSTRAEDVLTSSGRSSEAGRRATQIWAMLETPAAVLRAAEIAAASERLQRAGDGHQRPARRAAGRGDAGPRAAADEPGALPAGGARRAAGRSSTASTTTSATRRASRRSAVAGRRLGFDGKTLIHPGQVEICNRVFSPSADEVEHARRVIEAFEQATGTGRAWRRSTDA